MATWRVEAGESSIKLSAFLKTKLGDKLSIRQIKQAIEQNACQLNGQLIRFASTLVGKGDRVTFQDVLIKRERKSASILYQDKWILASNKPAGIASEDQALKPVRQAILLHRLDKDTTGILLWALNEETQKIMEEKFKKRLIEKTYLALVNGTPKQNEGRIENYLAKINSYEGQSLWGQVVKGSGVLAITDWRVLKTFEHSALIECRPLTGRTHQIRVHLNGLGHPILGDKQYGKRAVCSYRPSRCLLHAFSLRFLHPISCETLEIQAPIPDDFSLALKEISQI